MSNFLKVISDPDIHQQLKGIAVARESMIKKLNETGMTVDWALKNIKKLGDVPDEITDPRLAMLAKEVNMSVLNWYSLIDKDGMALPGGSSPGEITQQEVEDAEFAEATTPKMIDDEKDK